jgi:hypothetical protein
MWPFTSEKKVLEEIRKARKVHFRERFGDVTDELEVPPDLTGVIERVLEFEPTATHPRWTYVTDGMSDRKQEKSLRKQPFQALRVELVLHLREQASEWAPHLLGRLAAMPFGERRFFAFWQIIELGGPVDEFRKGAAHKDLDSVMLMPMHLDGEVAARITRTKEPVDLLWVVPLYKAEREMASRRYKELDILFEETGYETLTDLDRPCAIKPEEATAG